MSAVKAAMPDRYLTGDTPWSGGVGSRALSYTDSALIDVVHHAYVRFVKNLPTPEQTRQAASLNDEVRAGLESRCVVVASDGFARLPERDRREIRLLVSTIDNGDIHLIDNRERDFGAVYQHLDGSWSTFRPDETQLREIVLWTIDQFDLTLTGPAPCPWDKASTAHVLSLTLVSEQ